MAVVLVVDDEFGIVKLLEEVLTDEGHRVVIATNGQQALERAGKEKPNLVITDFMMPVMDGAALVKAMRADQQLVDVPVIVMSSIPEATVAERSPGYAAFVRKPFNIFAVVDLVAKLAKHSPAKTRDT
jgi:CheY-like chemotaxis protein